MIVHSHPTGNQFSRHLALAFLKENLLDSFHTSISWQTDKLINKLLPNSLRKTLSRRSYPESLQPFIQAYPIKEWGRMISPKIGFNQLTEHEKGLFSLDSIYQDIDEKVAKYIQSKSGIDTVYAYEDGALKIFQAAGDRIKAYDLPIAYWETAHRLYREEVERLPTWACTMTGNQDSQEKLNRKTEEASLADIIFCPSQFVASSIPKSISNNKPIVISRFGSPTLPSRIPISRKDPGVPLKLLFVGSMSQRKGLGDLFHAMKTFKGKQLELHILGSPIVDPSFYRQEFSDFTYHESRPHNEVLKLMQECDVFVLPSIVEGRAQVVQEAMSCGLPIIITPNTGNEDLVVPEETGFLVPIRSPEKIAEAIDWFLTNKQKLPEMSIASRKKAQDVTWFAYTKTIIEELKTLQSIQ